MSIEREKQLNSVEQAIDAVKWNKNVPWAELVGKGDKGLWAADKSTRTKQEGASGKRACRT